jgi:hypothetical protein
MEMPVPFDALAHFRRTMPYRPYAMRWKPGRCSPAAAATASAYPYIQPNPPAMVHWLVFDLDDDFASLQWRDAEVPPPTLMVLSPDTGKGHYLYGLKAPVCRSDAGRPRPLRYLAAIEAGLRDALEADRGYSGLLCKNPLWTGWSVHQLADLYALKDFEHWSAVPGAIRRPLPASGLGRNCALFDRLRQWAYQERRRHLDPDAWKRSVLAAAEEFNDFLAPLPHSEVRATAKSVTKWVWTRYTGAGSRSRRCGVMGLDKSLELSARQRLGAEYTAAQKALRTADRIDAARRKLTEEGKPVTAAVIASRCGVSLSTVRRYAQ